MTSVEAWTHWSKKKNHSNWLPICHLFLSLKFRCCAMARPQWSPKQIKKWAFEMPHSVEMKLCKSTWSTVSFQSPSLWMAWQTCASIPTWIKSCCKDPAESLRTETWYPKLCLKLVVFLSCVHRLVGINKLKLKIMGWDGMAKRLEMKSSFNFVYFETASFPQCFPSRAAVPQPDSVENLRFLSEQRSTAKCSQGVDWT